MMRQYKIREKKKRQLEAYKAEKERHAEEAAKAELEAAARRRAELRLRLAAAKVRNAQRFIKSDSKKNRIAEARKRAQERIRRRDERAKKEAEVDREELAARGAARSKAWIEKLKARQLAMRKQIELRKERERRKKQKDEGDNVPDDAQVETTILQPEELDEDLEQPRYSITDIADALKREQVSAQLQTNRYRATMVWKKRTDLLKGEACSATSEEESHSESASDTSEEEDEEEGKGRGRGGRRKGRGGGRRNRKRPPHGCIFGPLACVV